MQTICNTSSNEDFDCTSPDSETVLILSKNTVSRRQDPIWIDKCASTLVSTTWINQLRLPWPVSWVSRSSSDYTAPGSNTTAFDLWTNQWYKTYVSNLRSSKDPHRINYQLANVKNTITLYACTSKNLRTYCFYFLSGLKMVPSETGNNAYGYAKFWRDKQRVLW